MKVSAILLLVFCLLLTPTKASQADTSEAYLEYTQDRTVLVYKKCADKSKSGWGSGVIYEGTKVVTAEHVVSYMEGCQLLISRQNELQYPATVEKTDKDNDLALLSVAHDYGVTVSFVRSKLGESIVVVGYPAQLLDRGNKYLSILFGNISTKSISVGKGKRYVDRISAPIYFGNSGGPVFNELGQVVGIVSAGHMSVQGYFYIVRGYDVRVFLGVE